MKLVRLRDFKVAIVAIVGQNKEVIQFYFNFTRSFGLNLFFISSLILFSSNVLAEYSSERYNYLDTKTGTLHQGFGEGNTPEIARTVYSDRNLNMSDEFMAEISTTQRGLDVFIYTPESCDESSFSLVTLNISNQNVKFYKDCEQYTSYIVESEKGRDFVIEKFKRSNLVAIKQLDEKGRVVSFNAFGFSEMWQKLGGDAL
jgi:hypothetical protein